MFSRNSRLAVTLLVGCLLSATAALAAVDAAKAYEARHDQFHIVAGAFKAIMEGLKAEKPDSAAIAAKAKTIEGLAHQIPSWFPAGTGAESGVKTRAKPEIWSDAAGFAAAAKNLETQSAALAAIAATEDLAAISTQAKAMGGACGACHTKYRGPEIADAQGH